METGVHKDFTEIFPVRLNNWNQFKYPGVGEVVTYLANPYNGMLCSH